MQSSCSNPAAGASRRLILGAALAAGIAAAAMPHMQSVRAADLPATATEPANPAPKPGASASAHAPAPTVRSPGAADAAAPNDADANDETTGESTEPGKPQTGAKGRASVGNHGIFIEKGNKRIRIEGLGRDREYDSFEQFIQDAPALAILVFVTVLTVFLIPLLIVVLLIWYKLRKNRLAHETMLKLAERGVVPTATAMEAVASGHAAAVAAAATEASLPPTAPAYARAASLQRRTVWSDLRKGVVLTGIGLGLTFFSMLDDGTPNSVGLIFLFVGLGYGLLWYFEDRTTTPTSGPPAGGA
jgi:hypothetical protein